VQEKYQLWINRCEGKSISAGGIAARQKSNSAGDLRITSLSEAAPQTLLHQRTIVINFYIL
jgi:hypothetical protein